MMVLWCYDVLFLQCLTDTLSLHWGKDDIMRYNCLFSAVVKAICLCLSDLAVIQLMSGPPKNCFPHTKCGSLRSGSQW